MNGHNGRQHVTVNGYDVTARNVANGGHLKKCYGVCDDEEGERDVAISPGNCNGDKPADYVRNKHIDRSKNDILYHFALSSRSYDLEAMFGDVKYVCVGGSVRRMESIANFLMRQLGLKLPAGQSLVNIISNTDRYAMFKVGPILTLSHGIGFGSFSIMMHELIKLLHHARASDVCIVRLGTSGGLGLQPGTVVVTQEAVDTLLRPFLELHVVGKIVQRPSIVDQRLVNEIVSCSNPDDQFRVTVAKTMCAQDFYEGQGRLDGAFCDYTEQDKIEFLQRAYSIGVRNIEMESLGFTAMCHHANIPGAVVCVTMIDRLREDQVTVDKVTSQLWEERPALILSRFIRRRLDAILNETTID